jgi:hypothetical protein
MSFKRVEVKAGETVELSLSIYYDDLNFIAPRKRAGHLMTAITSTSAKTQERQTGSL